MRLICQDSKNGIENRTSKSLPRKLMLTGNRPILPLASSLTLSSSKLIETEDNLQNRWEEVAKVVSAVVAGVQASEVISTIVGAIFFFSSF